MRRPVQRSRSAQPSRYPNSEHAGQRHGRRRVHPLKRHPRSDAAAPPGARCRGPPRPPRDGALRCCRDGPACGRSTLPLRPAEGGQAHADRHEEPAARPAELRAEADRCAGQARRGQPTSHALAHRPEACRERTRPAAQDPRQASSHHVQGGRPRLVRHHLQHPESRRHRHHPLPAAGDRRPGPPLRERGAAARARVTPAGAPGGTGSRGRSGRGARGPEPEDRARPEAGRAYRDPPGRDQAHQEDPRQRRAGSGA